MAAGMRACGALFGRGLGFGWAGRFSVAQLFGLGGFGQLLVLINLFGQARILEASAQPQPEAENQQGAQYPQLVFLDAAEHAFEHRTEVIRRRCQCRGPDRRADAVEQQITARRVTRQADRHRHHRAQTIDETETQDPDVRMLADMLQRAVAHQLPARFAREQFAPVLAAEEIPQLIAGITAAEGHDHHQVDVHVSAEREEACEHQNGFAFEERAEKQGKVAKVVQKLLEHCLGAGEMNAQPNPSDTFMKVSKCVST